MTFVSEEEQGKFHQIEKFIEREIRKAELPASVGEGPRYEPAENRGRGRGRGGRSGSGGSGRGGRRRGGRKPEGAPSAAQTEHAAAPVDNDHASGRGEGNRGSRDRKRRHRGGRNRHRRGGSSAQPQGAPQSGE